MSTDGGGGNSKADVLTSKEGRWAAKSNTALSSACLLPALGQGVGGSLLLSLTLSGNRFNTHPFPRDVFLG